MVMALIVLVFGLPLWLTLWATFKVVRDDLSERRQKVIQLALVWLLPVVGPLCVMAVHRKAEKPSGQYREPRSSPDEMTLVGRAGAGFRALLDDD